MQVLYDALMTLGRSAEDARNGGWLCEDIGSAKGPKCVNGLITWHLGWHKPEYVTKMFLGDDKLVPAPLVAPAVLAGRALVRSIPESAWALLEEMDIDWIPDPVLLAIVVDKIPDEEVENIIITVNDLSVGTGEFELEVEEPFLGSVGAAEWFERAFDLLAKELPDPIPASPLTVADVLAGAPDLDQLTQSDIDEIADTTGVYL